MNWLPLGIVFLLRMKNKIIRVTVSENVEEDEEILFEKDIDFEKLSSFIREHFRLNSSEYEKEASNYSKLSKSERKRLYRECVDDNDGNDGDDSYFLSETGDVYSYVEYKSIFSDHVEGYVKIISDEIAVPHIARFCMFDAHGKYLSVYRN